MKRRKDQVIKSVKLTVWQSQNRTLRCTEQERRNPQSKEGIYWSHEDRETYQCRWALNIHQEKEKLFTFMSTKFRLENAMKSFDLILGLQVIGMVVKSIKIMKNENSEKNLYFNNQLKYICITLKTVITSFV